jgi:hypothetical protein
MAWKQFGEIPGFPGPVDQNPARLLLVLEKCWLHILLSPVL